MGKIKKESRIIENDQETIQGWEKVDKYLEEKSLAGLIVALLEADKLLNSALKKQGYPGKTIDDCIKSAKAKFNNLNGLLEARRIRKRLLGTKEYNINSLDLEDSIAAYRQSLLDLQSEAKSRLGYFERLIILADYYLPSKWKAIRKVLIYLALFFVVVLFLANTWPGQRIVLYVVSITHIVFSWVLAIISLILGILIVIIASLLYFERRKRRSI
jgi:hypothetical protein